MGCCGKSRKKFKKKIAFMSKVKELESNKDEIMSKSEEELTVPEKKIKEYEAIRMSRKKRKENKIVPNRDLKSIEVENFKQNINKKQ